MHYEDRQFALCAVFFLIIGLFFGGILTCIIYENVFIPENEKEFMRQSAERNFQATNTAFQMLSKQMQKDANKASTEQGSPPPASTSGE